MNAISPANHAANAVRTCAAPSIHAAFPGIRLTPPQYALVARIWNGADIRAWDAHHTTVLALLEKGVLHCEATSCELWLLTADEITRRQGDLEKRIIVLSQEIEALDAAMAAAVHIRRRTLLALSIEADNVTRLSAALAGDEPGSPLARRRQRELTIAETALADAHESLREIGHGEDRRRRRLEVAIESLTQARRRRTHLATIAARRPVAA